MQALKRLPTIVASLCDAGEDHLATRSETREEIIATPDLPRSG